MSGRFLWIACFGVVVLHATTASAQDASAPSPDAGVADVTVPIGDGGLDASDAIAPDQPDAAPPPDGGVEPDDSLDEEPDDSGEQDVEPEEDEEDPEPSAANESIRYFIERVDVVGNETTRDAVVRDFTSLRPGDVLDIDDPQLETLRWRLLGTGWFDDVRLRLSRGTRRGWVRLLLEVEERNTLVLQQLAAGVSEDVRRTTDLDPDLTPYLGVAVAETNLLGLGMGLSLSVLASAPQQGVRARFTEPFFFGSDFLFGVSLFANNAREFFGDDDARVSIVCPEPDDPEDPEPCPPEVEARNAVVFYKRYGASLGIGHDIGPSTRYTLDWQGEIVHVNVRPEAASEMRGTDVAPIDFSIDDGTSFVSAARIALTYDRRDDPGLTSQGGLVHFSGDLANRLLGSDYSFVRLQVLARAWLRTFHDHSIRFSLFGGIVFGRAPFFYKFYASDLSDLIPSRVLEMNIDRRTPTDFFGTAVSEMRAEEFGARADVEYSLPLYRDRGGGLRAIDLYLNLGIYALCDIEDFSVAIPGYRGLARIPVDMTFDLGFRADTSIGVLQFGFSNLLGFITP